MARGSCACSLSYAVHASWGFRSMKSALCFAWGAPGTASCNEVKVIATHHLEDIRAKLSDLKKLERLLAKTVARCSGKKAPNCPVLDILDVRRASPLHL